MEAFQVETDVQGGAGAARRAREVVAGALGSRLSRRRLEDVALLVTELVANGVRHGGADANSALHLRFVGRGRFLRVEVADPGGPARVAPRDPDVMKGGGLGLHIVDRVASRWGVDGSTGTSVWFELECR